MSATILRGRPSIERPIRSPLNNALEARISGRKGIGKHLQPGIVAYDNEDGTKTTFLLPLEAIERMRPTAAGKPVVGKSANFDHVKVQPGKKYDGVAVDSFWDGQSGWEAFNFDQMNEATAQACEKGYQVSCAYVPTEVDETPGLWHNIPYDAVILNGEYTHFAIVPNPRYEGAEIELLNSRKEPTVMNKVLKAALSLVPIKELKEILNSIESDQAEAEKMEKEKKNAEREEKRANAQKAYDAAMKNASSDEDRAKAKEAFEKANAEIDADPTPATPTSQAPDKPLGGGDVPPEPGVPSLDSSTSAAAPSESPEQAQEREKKALEAKNAADAEAKAKKEAEDKAAAEKKNAEAEEAKKKDEEKQNALRVKAKAEAAAKAEALRQERFNALKRAAEERGGEAGVPVVSVVTMKDKEDLGRARYGSAS